jgi:hypothetical protein
VGTRVQSPTQKKNVVKFIKSKTAIVVTRVGEGEMENY